MRYVVARGVPATQDAALAAAMGTVNGLAVTNKVLTSGTATLTVPGHSFIVGQRVTVAGVDAVFNGTVTLTAVATTTISYVIQPPDVAAVTATGTVTGSVAFAVTNKALTSNVATLTVPGHGFTVSESVVIAGVDATFNGTVTLTAVTSTTISYAVTHANVTSTASTGGTATGSVATTVTNKALTSGVATLTAPGHGFTVGEVVTVAGVDSVFNGTPTLTAVTSTTVSYAILHTDVASVAATGAVSGTTVDLVLTLTASEDATVTRAWSVADVEPRGSTDFGVTSTLPMLSETFSQAVGGTVFYTLAHATDHARTVSEGQ